MTTELLFITSFLVIITLSQIPKIRKHLRLNKWRKALNIDNHLHQFALIYSDLDGFAISKQSRINQDAFEYTYGEIKFVPFIALLSLTKLNKNSIFMDLGSGIGKAVIATSMVFECRQYIGVELLTPLHNTATAQHEKIVNSNAHKINFINANFLDIDFTPATHIFINATAIIGDTWDRLIKKLEDLRPGTIVITTTKELPQANFVLIRKTSVEMSWGVVSAYIYIRCLDGGRRP